MSDGISVILINYPVTDRNQRSIHAYPFEAENALEN
jgi:hypothetical protein